LIFDDNTTDIITSGARTIIIKSFKNAQNGFDRIEMTLMKRLADGSYKMMTKITVGLSDYTFSPQLSKILFKGKNALYADECRCFSVNYD
jgi:hypothetical protein